MKDWAAAIARGIPSDLYWRSTPAETEALLEALAKREADLQRRAIRRSGLIAATMINISPYTRGRRVKPDDFISDRAGPRFGTPEWNDAFSALAATHNQRVQ